MASNRHTCTVDQAEGRKERDLAAVYMHPAGLCRYRAKIEQLETLSDSFLGEVTPTSDIYLNEMEIN